MISTPCVTSSSSGTNVRYPLIKFAAIRHVQYAVASDGDPEVVWKKGGVMLTEVVPGEYAIIVKGGSYDVTVDRCIMTAKMEICPDFRRFEIRWSVSSQDSTHRKSWTYLRFAVATDLTKFAREVFAAFDVIATRHELISDRIWDIAYEAPANFTNYCREYLGQDYLDDLKESDDE